MKLILALCFATFCLSAQALKINRKILVVWDKTEYSNLEYTFSQAHQRLEVIFNHYGMKFEYLDASEDIDIKNFKINEYLGVLVWLTDISVKDPNKILELLNQFNHQKLKIAFLGELGFQTNYQNKNLPTKEIAAFFKKFDLQYEGNYWGALVGLQHHLKAPASYVEFERPLKNELSPLVEIRPSSSKVKSWLDVSQQGSKETASAIMEHELFFWAQRGYELFRHPLNSYTQWRIDPFRLARWFWGNLIPLFPDTNTINGKRIYYAHIDGDGLINMDRSNRKALCGEIINDEVIEKYEYPITVSFIGAEIKELTKNQKRTRQMLQTLTGHPWVKWATHSYTHPLTWELQPSEFDKEQYLEKPKSYKGGPIVAYPMDGYSKIDYNYEINESYRLIKEMIPDKRQSPKILFWTGNCRPNYEALVTSEKGSFAGINGGDSRFDKKFPTYSAVWPLYRKVKELTQVYSSNSNENTYTNNWTGPFYAYKDVIETFKNTEKPHRIKPINIYFHFYSAEHRSSVKALQTVFNWALKQDIFPIYIDEYVSIINSFEELKVEKLGSHRYRVEHGNVKELRLESKDVFVDVSASKNVLGYKVAEGVTYIHLGPQNSSDIIFTEKEKKSNHLIEGNGKVELFESSKNGIKYKGSSLAPVHSITIFTTKKIFKNKPISSIEPLEKNIVKITFTSKEVDTTLEFTK